MKKLETIPYRPWSSRVSFRAILSLFFVWGFLTCLNDTLLPQLKFAFDLSFAQAAGIPAIFFVSCFFFAVPSARFIRLRGYKHSMTVALCVMSLGSAAIWIAAAVAQFSVFLVAMIFLGGGVTLLQVAVSPYVAALGPTATSPSRFSLALGFNSLGTMIAPLFGGWLILQKSAGARQVAVNELRGPYLAIAASLLLLALLVALSRLPAMSMKKAESPVRLSSLLRHRPLRLGAAACFLYAGAEVGIGSMLINYLSLPSVGDFSRHTAALWVALYWGGATFGRFVGWSVLRRYAPERVLACCAMGASLLVLLSSFSSGAIAVASILAVGLCNSMIVPIIVMLAIAGFGERTAQASSVMVAANIGAGAMPLILGVLSDHMGLHHAFLLTIVSYAFVVFYALHGARRHLLHAQSASQP